MNLLLIALGVALLYAGGEALVRGASALGRRFGLSSLVIGLTVVSTGTSSPELAATLAASFEGAPAIAFGNVVGSNIANLGLVLGLTALLWPLNAGRALIRRDVPLMLAASLLLCGMAANGLIGRPEGIVLVVLLIAFLVYLVHSERQTAGAERESHPNRSISVPRNLALVIVGVILLIVGAKALVVGAVGVARFLGISERVIGLTVVAFGTSLPELASCLVAALRHEGDIVLGNLVGSNIFNILFILGVTTTVRPLAIELEAATMDLVVMVAFAALAGLLIATRQRLTKLEGGFLFVAYLVYVGSLFA